MADAYLIQSDTLTDIADAIRERNSESSTVTYTPASMASAILNLGTKLAIAGSDQYEIDDDGYISIDLANEYGIDPITFAGYFGYFEHNGEPMVCLVTDPKCYFDWDLNAYYTYIESTPTLTADWDLIYLDDVGVLWIMVDPAQVCSGYMVYITIFYKDI